MTRTRTTIGNKAEPGRGSPHTGRRRIPACTPDNGNHAEIGRESAATYPRERVDHEGATRSIRHAVRQQDARPRHRDRHRGEIEPVSAAWITSPRARSPMLAARKDRPASAATLEYAEKKCTSARPSIATHESGLRRNRSRRAAGQPRARSVIIPAQSVAPAIAPRRPSTWRTRGGEGQAGQLGRSSTSVDVRNREKEASRARP